MKLSTLPSKRSTDREAGFTLIELLIVIVILGVLAGITVFSVRGIVDRGEASACKSEVSTVQTAVEAYYAKKNAYPASMADLTTAGTDQFLKSTPKYATVASGGVVGVVTGAPCTA